MSLDHEYKLGDKVRALAGLYQLLEGRIIKIETDPNRKSGQRFHVRAHTNRIFKVNQANVELIK